MKKEQDKTDFVVNRTIDKIQEALNKVEVWDKLSIINKSQAQYLRNLLNQALTNAKTIPSFLHHERQQGYEDYLFTQEEEENHWAEFLETPKKDISKLN